MGDEREHASQNTTSVSIQLHSSCFIDSSWANDAAQLSTGHDWIRQLQERRGQHDETGRDGEWAGNSRALRLARLGPCTSEQPCKARLPVPAEVSPSVRQSVSQGQPGNLAPSSCCGSRQQQLVAVHKRAWLWSLHVCFFRGQTVCALTRVSMRTDDSNINSNSRRLSAVPYRIVPAPYCTVSCGIVIVSSHCKSGRGLI
jgi:hypothetical protein